MSDDSAAQTPNRQARLEHVLADYLHSVEHGRPLDRPELIVAHPDLADELQSFFRNHDSIGRLAEPLKAAADAPTLLGMSELVPTQGGLTVRYFGDYELLEEIARGGMGVVFKARQVNLNRIVALKMILAGQLANDSDVKRFYAEAEAAARLDHPGIVPIFEIGHHDSQHYFSMAFIEGESLAKKVANGPLPPREASELVKKVAETVEYAHAKGIIHRDLKPANVLLDGQGQPKVTDFGLAKQIQGDSGLTGTGQILGTPSYMPPEQASGKLDEVGVQSDVYALGALLYCLLTGRPPFQAASPTETLLQVLEQEPVAPRQLNPHVPLDLETIALKCLEKEPARRYAKAADLADELGRFLRGEPILARPVGPLERTWRWCKRNRAVAGLTAAVAVVLLAGTVASTSLGLVANHNASVAALNARDAESERDRANDMSQAALREKEIAEQQRQVADEQRQLAEQQQREAQLQSKAALQARDEMQVARKAAEESRVAADEARGRAETALYFNRVRLSYQYWLADNLSDSRRLLNECPLDRRGWEWRYLDRIHRADLLTLPGNGQFTNVLKFSSDGKRMAAYAYSGDRGVRIWDLTTNQPLSEITLVRTQRSFNCADLSPDGKTVALGDEAGAISLWNAETGQLIREFARLPKSVGSLSFSPDGKWLAAARAEGRNGEQLLPLTESPRNEDLVVWDVASGNEVFHPKGHGFTALFSPDSSRLLSFKMNTALRLHPAVPETFLALFDTAGWTEVATEKSGHVRSFSFSGDGKLLAIGGQDRQRDVHFVRVIDPATGNELANLTPRHLVGDIALSHRGESLAIASSLGPSQIDVWDVKQKRLAQVLRGHTSFVNGISFSPDGRLASCSWDNTIKFWNTTAGQQLTRIPGQVGLLADPVEFAPGGDLFAYGQRNTVSLLGSVRTVTLVDAATGKTRHTLAGHTGGANCLAFSADGARLVSGGRKGDVKVWDTKSGKSICSVRGGDGEICAAALSPDGRTFVTAHEPPEMTRARFGQGQFRQIPVAIKVWDADTGSQLAKLTGHPGGVFRLAFGPDGTVLASAGSGGIKYWDLATGTERRGLEPEILQSATSDLLLFNPTGDRLLTSGFNTLQVCDVATGRALTKIQGHRAFFLANGAAISPDQTRLATAWIDEVKLWDLATGQEILTLPLSDIVSAEKPRVAALQWTADGQQLRAVSPDGAVLTWDGSPRP